MVLFCSITVLFNPTGGVKSLWPSPYPLSFQPGRGNLHISSESDWCEGWEWHRPDHCGGETWWVRLVMRLSGIAGSGGQGLDPETLSPWHGQSQMAYLAFKKNLDTPSWNILRDHYVPTLPLLPTQECGPPPTHLRWRNRNSERAGLAQRHTAVVSEPGLCALAHHFLLYMWLMRQGSGCFGNLSTGITWVMMSHQHPDAENNLFL